MSFWRKENTLKKKSVFWEWTESLVVAIIGALFLRTFVIQAFKIPSSSMEETLLVGDFLFVNKFIYGTRIPLRENRFLEFQEPKSGHVIVFRYPFRKRDFIKRCVAVSGDTVQIINKLVYVNGKPLEESYARHDDPNIYTSSIKLEPGEYQKTWETGGFKQVGMTRDNFGPVIIPEDYYFMMGDNRDNSDDSRFWGPLHKKFIKGRAFILYWSWKKWVPFYRMWEKVRWTRIGRLIR
jgi:signal peptidase I